MFSLEAIVVHMSSTKVVLLVDTIWLSPFRELAITMFVSNLMLFSYSSEAFPYISTNMLVEHDSPGGTPDEGDRKTVPSEAVHVAIDSSRN